jgi:hypothetical protein
MDFSRDILALCQVRHLDTVPMFWDNQVLHIQDLA